MKSKRFAGLLWAVLLICTLLSPVDSYADTVHEAQRLMDGIVSFQLQKSGAGSVQAWIDGDLTANAGKTAEWYVLALSQSGTGYDFSSYQTSLAAYLSSTNVTSATSRQKYALAFIATGSSDAYIAETLDNSIGQQGIMSWVYGMHLLNNGYTSEAHTTEEIVNTLLSLQRSDGGWALTGAVSDVDVTAMTVQALAPHYQAHASAIDRALALLSERQLEGGDYASYGTPNPESTAQVITALSALGLDPMTDERFIKNGSTLLDGLEKYRLADGSFSHTAGGAFNHNATVQVFYALTAYKRQQSGSGSLYLLDHRDPAGLSGTAQTEPAVSSTEAPAAPVPTETAASSAETMVSVTAGSETVLTIVSDTAAVTETSAETVTTTGIPETSAAASATTTTRTTIVTETTAGTSDMPAGEGTAIGYRLPVCLVIAGAGGVVCLVLFLLKKRHPKNFIAVLIVTAAAIGFVCLTDFRSAEDYYSGESSVREDAACTVTMTIRCDTIAGKSDASHIPADGVMLETTEFAIAEGDTVFDVLTMAAQRCGIQMEYSGTPEMAYVSGIGYLYEFDFGDLSGWVFHVNGEAPSVGCGEYILQDGDEIAWLYTCDLGNDVK